MTKTILALAAAGILGAAMLPAHAMVPGQSATMQNKTTTTTTQSQARLNKDRQLLRRDVKLGRTTAAARLRREINADERSINRAKQGGQQTTGTQPMQPLPPAQTGSQPSQMQNQNDTQQNQTTK